MASSGVVFLVISIPFSANILLTLLLNAGRTAAVASSFFIRSIASAVTAPLPCSSAFLSKDTISVPK